jgi:hypothetical protein
MQRFIAITALQLIDASPAKPTLIAWSFHYNFGLT